MGIRAGAQAAPTLAAIQSGTGRDVMLNWVRHGSCEEARKQWGENVFHARLTAIGSMCSSAKCSGCGFDVLMPGLCGTHP